MRVMISAAALLLLAACGGDGGEGGSSKQAQSAADRAAADQAKVAALPAPYNEANYALGMQHFRECRACHTTVEGGGNRAGPNLYNVIGRPAAQSPNFNYSDELRGAGITWDAATLDRRIAKPSDVVPHSYMAFRGFTDPRVRRDVIAYMMVETTPPPPAN